MSKIVQGTLGKAYHNDKGYWSINVDEIWYGTFKDDYSSLEGLVVEFESSTTSKGGREYFNAKNVKAVAGPSPAKPVISGANDSRQVSIVKQSSYKIAVDIVNNLIELDKVPLGTKKTALDTAVGMVDHIARHVFNNVMGDSLFVPEDEAEVEEDPSAPPTEAFNPIEA